MPSHKLNKIFSIQKRCIRLLFGKELNYDHAEYYKTCARTRSIDEYLAPKNYTLEHTKPLFTEYKFLTVYNLHKIFLLNEIFKIKKYAYPISLAKFINNTSESSRNSRINNIVVPDYHLDLSRHQFLYSGIKTWNKISTDTIIHGDSFHSDQSMSSCAAKNIFKRILLSKQSSGDGVNWEKQNRHI